MCEAEIKGTVRVTPITIPLCGIDTKLSAKTIKGKIVELSFISGCGSFMVNKNIVAVAQMEVDKINGKQC